MPEWVKSWWSGLTEEQRNVVIRVASWLLIAIVVMSTIIVVVMLFSYIFAGTDYGPLGQWIQSWFN